MRQESKEPVPYVVASHQERDPEKILELIKQLDLDLITTQKNVSRRD